MTITALKKYPGGRGRWRWRYDAWLDLGCISIGVGGWARTKSGGRRGARAAAAMLEEPGRLMDEAEQA